jgi:hypothetical protein
MMRMLITTKPLDSIHLTTRRQRVFPGEQEVRAEWPIHVVHGVVVFEQDNDEYCAPENVFRDSIKLKTPESRTA